MSITPQIRLEEGLLIEDRYVLGVKLGAGGMGSVYRARDLELHREIAIKILHAGLVVEHEHQIRFEREGKALSAITHPHVITFYRFGWWQGFPYIAMEYLEGKSLSEELNRIGQFPISQCLEIAMQICGAVSEIHSKGIIHRDLKPSNIILLKTEGEVFAKVVDFGLAKIVSEEGSTQHLTQTGALVGSVYYMSPEQCKGKIADQRSEIYSLGCLLYECLSGSPPLVSDNPIGLLHKHNTESPQPLSKLEFMNSLNADEQDILTRVDAVLLKCMSKDPNSRYQTTSSMMLDLQRIIEGRGNEITAPLPLLQKQPRHTALICLLLALPVVLCSLLSFSRSADQPITQPTRKIRSSSISRDVYELKFLQPDERLRRAIELATRVENGEQIDNYGLSVIFGNIASGLSQEQRYKELIDITKRGIAVQERKAVKPVFLGNMYCYVAEGFLMTDNIEQADLYSKKSLQVLASANGAIRLDSLCMFYSLRSNVLSRLNQYGEAAKILEKVLHEPVSEHWAASYIPRLSYHYLLLRQFDKEEQLYRASLIRAKQFSPSTINRLMEQWHSQLKKAERLDLWETRVDQLLNIVRSSNVSEELYIALFTSGNQLFELGNSKKAEKYFREGIALQERTGICNKDSLAIMYNGLARCITEKVGAPGLHALVSKIIEDSAATELDCINMFSLAGRCSQVNEFAEAERLLDALKKLLPAPALSAQFVFKQYGKFISDGSPIRRIKIAALQDCVSVLSNKSTPLLLHKAETSLAEALAADHQPVEALKLANKIPVFSTDSNQLYTRLIAKGWSLLQLDKKNQAAESMEQALQIAGHRPLPEFIQVIHKVAAAYNSCGFTDEATRYYRKAVEEAKANTDPNNPLQAMTVECFASYLMQRRMLHETAAVLATAQPAPAHATAKVMVPYINMERIRCHLSMLRGDIDSAIKSSQSARELIVKYNLDATPSLLQEIDILLVSHKRDKETASKIESLLQRCRKSAKNQGWTHIIDIKEAMYLTRFNKESALPLIERLLQKANESENAQNDPTVYDTASQAYYENKKFELAIINGKKVVAIRCRELGKNHPDTIASQHKLDEMIKAARW